MVGVRPLALTAVLQLAQKQVLVTGGAGFIGCAVSQRLAAQCARYVVIDVLHPQVHLARSRPSRLHEAAELVVADVTEETAWDNCLSDFHPDIVIHLAAETGTAQSLSEATRHANVNVVGTTQMLDAFGRSSPVPEVVLVCSSRAVYGEGRWVRAGGSIYYPGMRSHRQLETGQWDFPDSEPLPSDVLSTNPSPTSVYGATKLAQEHLLRAWCGARDVAVRMLRLQNVYGPGQSLTNSYTGIVSLFSQMGRAGEVIPVYEDGRITRDFVYIDDVASAIVAALVEYEDETLLADVGSGRGTTLMQLAEEIAGLRGAPAPRVNGMFRDGDVRHAACSVEATEQAIGWRPEWTLARGLSSLQDWIDSELDQ